ncbi:MULTISPECIES: LacI family DNA-binding transcriptional regulator [Dickeya]|uniref:LacI family DNA-binding transcriptional regulator n=1 Tax=Dickeya TaxID=204037 RepID=UPI00067622AA|nr:MULTISPECIES: LacI family DNA-binding transcriptional regulator [Dickeya]AYH46978.1 LacI family transcriptional regulator [Dickeya fangzhongdai]UGA51847.1 LacI family DNA-binding transcriptional regulator [Dickeya fangzhongdai]UMB77707.1 LacI family DNA-binding transcriptional regulator [Dickeya fangzhongdai]UWH08195.1 LacI family DNA-binding transcriptional regulator [Dickeya fangzhongdai]
MNKKRITSIDVARCAGVSPSAVSRTYSAPGKVSQATRSRVLAAANELGYRPNALARALVNSGRQGSGIVAVVMGEFDNPFQPWLFGLLTQALQQHGLVPMLVSVTEQCDIRARLQQAQSWQVEAAIISAGSLSREATGRCLELSLPMVLMGREDQRETVTAVLSDNRLAGELAADHLISLGLTRLAYIGGRQDGQASLERLAGFRQRLAHHGLPEPVVTDNPDYAYHSGYHAMCRLRQQHPLVEGVFCACDALAFGALDALRLTDGPACKVVGCDDTPQAAWEGYRLTTVRQPVELLVEQVMRHLQRVLSGEAQKGETVRITPTLIVR